MLSILDQERVELVLCSPLVEEVLEVLPLLEAFASDLLPTRDEAAAGH